MLDKKALKPAGLTAAIVLCVFEAIAVLVVLIDPEGGLLRIDISNPLLHAAIAAAALVLGVSAYIRESKNNRG